MKARLRRRTAIRALLALGACLWMQCTAGAPATYSASEVKAAFLYRFAAYVEWPTETMEAPRFVIAVLGADAVAASLERALATLKIKDRQGEVRRIDDIRAARQAHIVYIGSAQAEELDTLLPQLANRPVLIVTDGERGLDAGGMLNFRMVGRRVRFEVAPEAAEQAGLSISADLLAVALQVRRRNLRSDELCPPPLLHAPWLPCNRGLLARRPRGWPLPCERASIACGRRIEAGSARAWMPPA